MNQEKITKKDVEYISHLSRIHLKDEEIIQLKKTLEDILTYVEKLNKLDVSGVEPTSHVLPLKNVYRPDTLKPSLDITEIKKMAKDMHQDFFKVPRVVE